jgi:hypothetical protein
LSIPRRSVLRRCVGRKRSREGDIVRRVIVPDFVSLDGVIEDPGGVGELDPGRG